MTLSNTTMNIAIAFGDKTAHLQYIICRKLMIKISLLFIFGTFSFLYTAFVTTCLWNWFAAPAFYLSSISYWNMVGLSILIDMLLERNIEAINVLSEFRWKTSVGLLALCIPDSKKEDLNTFIQSQSETQYGEIFLKAFGVVTGNTWILIMGIIVRTFLL